MLKALVVRNCLRSAAISAWKMPTIMAKEMPLICTAYQQNKFSLNQVRFAAHLHLTMKAVEQRIMLVLSLYDKDEFHFEIPDGDSDNFKTPRDIYQYICDKKIFTNDYKVNSNNDSNNNNNNDNNNNNNNDNGVFKPLEIDVVYTSYWHHFHREQQEKKIEVITIIIINIIIIIITITIIIIIIIII
ncbi:Acyl carrier protein [Dirofilaria immitis]|nr:Acyl carrier protein [Dirofilaria immitis]